jgi:hypothetical protein
MKLNRLFIINEYLLELVIIKPSKTSTTKKFDFLEKKDMKKKKER